MIQKGSRVRFRQDEHDTKRRERGEAANPPLVPGPNETFVVQAIIPWIDDRGKEHFDGKAWANLGSAHPMVSLEILELA